MIRVIQYKKVMIQQWHDKFSYRDDTGQWFVFKSLAETQRNIDA